MDYELVDAYIQQLHYKADYNNLSTEQRRSAVFEASELLSDEYGAGRLTPRIVALQTLYMLEGEAEEFAKLKRHGVESYSVKGVSISFKGSDIAPAVAKLLKPKTSAKVGRLI